ncbi:MarR family winged helix-turn-helix transcriptional regulator [Streptomyces sp. NPDC058664]|uniref:MarR family winged helix-turn-helix transcriptional regulator n=1 Tax=unclassified Streptomyces TaxID=2593676 RepID=UPI003647D7D0
MTTHAPDDRFPSAVHDGRLSYTLFQLARAHRGYAASMLREMNLHPGQELLLMQLFDKEGRTQSELLEAVGLDHSTVSKSLRRMQEAGLLTREPAEHDRRAVIVRLTDKGRSMEKPIAAMWKALEETSAKNLGKEEIEAFVAIAQIITRTLTEREGSAPATGGAPVA